MWGPLVLIVDDDSMVREALALAMELKGCRVAVASNGLQALAAVERERPALVLLDLDMPVLDGRGFARELTRRGIQLPIVLISADSDGPRWAQEIGAATYLMKPFDLDALLAAVDPWTIAA